MAAYDDYLKKKITYAECRKILLSQIVEARHEYFRLKCEIAELEREPRLPVGSYIGKYTSNSTNTCNRKYTYHTLGNKNAVLPSATDSTKLTKKLHLGLDNSPQYRIALVEVEKLRILQIKLETLEGISQHLASVKSDWKLLRKNKPNLALAFLLHAMSPTSTTNLLTAIALTNTRHD
jgi:hypothetical protein